MIGTLERNSGNWGKKRRKDNLVKLVERKIRSEHHRSLNRPVYLVGESLGACLVLSVSSLSTDIDLVLLLANPATSISKSPLQPILSLLQFMPDLLSNLSLPLVVQWQMDEHNYEPSDALNFSRRGNSEGGEAYKLFWPEQSEFVRMAARFGVKIVPFGIVGEDDFYDILCDYEDQIKIPFLKKYMDELTDEVGKLRITVDGEVGNQDAHFLGILPKSPGRFYFHFGKPIETEGRKEELRDRKKAHELLGALRNGVLGQFTRKHKPHSSLDLPRSNRRLLVVPGEPGRLLSKLLEDVVDEAVHDAHGLAGDPNVRVDLLEDLEDVDLVSLHALLVSLLLLVSGGCSGLLGELLPGLGLLLCRGFLRHGLLSRLLLGGLLLGFGRHRKFLKGNLGTKLKFWEV
ncbi:hypothetical protein ACLB2K_064438 [Fragaria x ananassa]